MGKILMVVVLFGLSLTAQARELTVNLHQKAQIQPGVELSFDKVINDSRCPENAMCVWAGNFTVQMTLHNDQEQQIVIDSEEPFHFKNFVFELKGMGGCKSEKDCFVTVDVTSTLQ